MKSSLFSVYMAYRRPTASLMAHMKGMLMWDMLVGLGTRLRPRARAPGLDYAPREPSRHAMRQWRNWSLSELLYARTGLKLVCLCIPEHTQHYPVVGHSLIHQAVALSRHHH